jgi:F-box protein 9
MQEAPVLQALPDEMMVEVLTHVSPYVLGHVACVCKAWRAVVADERLWRQACDQAFKQQFDQEAMTHEVVGFDNSWRNFFLVRPHLRFDGIYVSRNTYCRVGVIEMRERKPVHMVSYYRYWRFFDDGTLNYRTSPLTVSRVAKSLRPRLISVSVNRDRYYSGDNTVFKGRWILKGSKLFVVIVYPNSRSTEIR